MPVAALQSEQRIASARLPDRAGRPLLAAGDLRATVAPEAGGRIAAFWRDSRQGGRLDILAPLDEAPFEPTAWPKAGLYPLAPWSNRIAQARFRAAGREATLAPHPACAPHALHGFSQRAPWVLADRDAAELTMRFTHDGGGEGWPWAFDVTQSVRLDPLGLTIEMAIANRSREPMPAGFGLHPFFAAGPGDVIDLAAGAEWDTDEEGCATRRRLLSGAASRLSIAAHGAAFTRHLDDWRGVASLRRADGSRVILQASHEFGHLVVHAPERSAYACIEPVTHVVDAFNLAARDVADTGIILLEPGEKRSATARISLL